MIGFRIIKKEIMKKFLRKLVFVGSLIGLFALGLVMLIGVVAFQSSIENNVREQAYAEGQVDAMNDDVSFVKLVKDPTSDTEKLRKLAYAQGLETAFDGDIRIKAVTDSTYVWTKSPWGKDNAVPTDTILIKK